MAYLIAVHNHSTNHPFVGRGVVCIVVGGDKEFLLRITRIARNIDNIKLVVVEGHGNATDFLSFICKSECESRYDQ